MIPARRRRIRCIACFHLISPLSLEVLQDGKVPSSQGRFLSAGEPDPIPVLGVLRRARDNAHRAAWADGVSVALLDLDRADDTVPTGRIEGRRFASP